MKCLTTQILIVLATLNLSSFAQAESVELTGSKAFLQTEVGLSMDQAQMVLINCFIDENARNNIKLSYLPSLKAAKLVSSSTALTAAQKQAKLQLFIAEIRQSIQFHSADTAFKIISPYVNYKLEKFEDAVAAQDFNKTTEMASSASSLIKGLLN